MADKKVPEPKFKIAQKVKFTGDNDEEAGEVLSYSFDGKEYYYKISAREVDMTAKKIIDGVKNCVESELAAVKEK